VRIIAKHPYIRRHTRSLCILICTRTPIPSDKRHMKQLPDSFDTTRHHRRRRCFSKRQDVIKIHGSRGHLNQLWSKEIQQITVHSLDYYTGAQGGLSSLRFRLLPWLLGLPVDGTHQAHWASLPLQSTLMSAGCPSVCSRSFLSSTCARGPRCLSP